METKRIDDYFKKTRQLPLAMSLTEVQSLVGLKGATSPPKKSWWNLNNIIIMSTSIIIITATTLFLNTPETKANYSPVARTLEISTDDYNELEETSSSYVLDIPQKEGVKLMETSTIPPSLLDQKESLTKERDEELIQNIGTPDDLMNQEKPLMAHEGSILSSESEGGILDPIEPSPIEDLTDHLLEEEPPLESKLGGDFDGETKTVTKTISTENINTFQLNHSNGDINISVWDKDEIEVIATFKLKTADPEDTKLGLEDFDVNLNTVGSTVNVTTNWDELNNCSCTNKTSEPKGIMKLLYFPSKNKAKTDEGESFEYENFKITYEVKIPKKLNLDVSNKYANIVVPEIDGDLDANLFRGGLTAKNVSNNVDLVVKYGSLTVGNFIEGDVHLFRSDATMGQTDRLDLKANYSTVNYGGGKELNLSAFRTDLISEGAIDELEGSHKYGKLKLKGHIVSADLTVFRSELTATTFDKLDLNASYSELTATKIHQFDIQNSFRCEFKFEEVAKVEGTLKYTPLKIELLTDMVDVDAFRGEIEIKQVIADFKQMNFKTKYTDINLSFNPEAKYELDAQTTYTDFKVPGEIMNISLQNGVNNNRNHFVGTFNKASTKATSKVYVDSFQGTIRLD